MVQRRNYQNEVRLPKVRFHATLTHFGVQAGLMSFNLSLSLVFIPCKKNDTSCSELLYGEETRPTSPQAQPMPLRQQLAVTFVV